MNPLAEQTPSLNLTDDDESGDEHSREELTTAREKQWALAMKDAPVDPFCSTDMPGPNKIYLM